VAGLYDQVLARHRRRAPRPAEPPGFGKEVYEATVLAGGRA
jgi:hypothetical protein